MEHTANFAYYPLNILTLGILSSCAHNAIAPNAFVSDRIPQSAYQSGRILCNPQQDPFDREHGKFIEVPIDYSDASKGKTPIYFYFPKSFDIAKPTFAFLTGGPGQSVHILDIPAAQFLIDLPFNLLLMDQRGIACSAPIREEDSVSPNFYSSERIARDLEEIRKSLGIEKLSVYGASYGTVPGTIYGSLFPDSARSLVLEGTVFTGFELMFKTDSSVNHLGQKLYDSLDPETQRLFKTYLFSVSPDGSGYGDFVRAILKSRGKVGLKEVAGVIKEAMATSNPDKINEWFFSAGATAKDNYYNDSVNRILFCKEFGATDKSVAMLQKLTEAGKVEDIPDSNDYATNACPRFGFNTKIPSTFVAEKFPVTVPVTYFQGGGDSATIPLGFSKHFKSVPKGKHIAWILVDGGHMPTQEVNRSGDPRQIHALQRIFIAALKGENPEKADVEVLTDKKSSLRWAFASKE